MKQLTQAIILGIMLGGCSLAPNYSRPDVPLAEKWINVALKEQQDQQLKAAELGWREFFRDPRLQKLIETALAHNHDLKKAALNVELSQAQHGIVRADRLPTLGLNGSFTRAKSRGLISEQYKVGLGISNFELDFFGRVKSQSEAALNKYLATKEARDAAQLSVINAVAKTYYQWRVANALKNLSKKTLHSRQKSSQLIQLRFKEGLASGIDVSTARSSIETARSDYQQQLRNAQQAENALSMLVGQPLTQLDLPEGASLLQQFPDKRLFAGIPSQILLKRPDIRQAEYALKSANANIGAARAAMFPIISLTASTGYASNALSSLWDTPSRLWSFAPTINFPLFDMGKRRANVKVSEINQKIVIADYQKTVQAAFRDVNDALVARQTLSAQYQAEKKRQKATAQTLSLVKLQLQEGLADGLNLLDARRADYATRQGLLATRLQMLNNRVDLYTALGGGLAETKQQLVTTDKQ
ncbi:MAG: transporter [Gammaproteobacteria bacterium]|nr:MAG: transporter [Gammaproteobacteria bacterium]